MHSQLTHLNRCRCFAPRSQIAKKSTNLRPHVEAWEKAVTEVDRFMDVRKTLPDQSESSSAESNSDESDTDSGEDTQAKAALCDKCKPPRATG